MLRLSNILKPAPAFINNLLAVSILVLTFLIGLKEQAIELFTALNCSACIAKTTIVVTILTTVLTFLKLFTNRGDFNANGK